MFSSRNIHFIFLGIILGATFAYILAFQQAESAVVRPAASEGGMPANHPAVSGGKDTDLLKQAVQANPDDPEVLVRYATVLLKDGHFAEAERAYRRAADLDPKNLEIRSLLGTLLWSMKDMEGARREFETGLKQDPKHVPSLHGLLLVTLDADHNLAKAEQLFAIMEKADPKYPMLATIRERLSEERQRGTK